MNYESCGQTVAFGDPSIASLAATQQSAFVNQVWPCRPMDCSINTTAPQEGGVGSIHDCIHVQFGDVSKFCSENCGHRMESLPPPAP
jgi:hypothetical protein